MEKIKIITDSASDIPKELIYKYNIGLMPVLVSYENKTIREFYDIEPEEYWKLLLTLEEIPSTSQIPIDTLLKTYEKALEEGYTKLLYIALNSEGSGTYGTSLIARDMFYEENGKDLQIEIVDSKSYTFMYGSVVVECAQKVESGEKFEDIVNFAIKRLETVRAYLGVFDLKYLKKSGRISGGTAFVGEALGLKPISKVANGSVTVCDKARGEDNLIKKIIANVKKEAKNPSENTACIMYGLCEDKILIELEKMLLIDIGFKEVTFAKFGAAISTNTGPKAFGVFYHI